MLSWWPTAWFIWSLSMQFCHSSIFVCITPSFHPNEDENWTFQYLTICLYHGINSLLCWQSSYFCQWELCALNEREWGHNCLRIMLLKLHNVFYFYREHYIRRVKNALWRKRIMDWASQGCLEWGWVGRKRQMTAEVENSRKTGLQG